jgi:TRAP-type C4-dicarboxylate transport system permease small subunit
MATKGLKTRLAEADELLDRGLYYGSAVLLMIIASAVFYSVVMRYAFNAAPIWAEQAPRVFFVWMTYLAIAVATRRGQNIRVTFFIEMVPPRPRLIIQVIMHLIIIIMLVVVFWNVWPIIALNLKGTMMSTGWNNAWSFAPLPISCALMTAYEARWIIRSIQQYLETGDFKDEGGMVPGSDD